LGASINEIAPHVHEFTQSIQNIHFPISIDQPSEVFIACVGQHEEHDPQLLHSVSENGILNVLEYMTGKLSVDTFLEIRLLNEF